MKRFLAGVILAVSICGGASAQTQHVLNDLDLRAEYCAPVLEEHLTVIDQIIARHPTNSALNAPLINARAIAAENGRRLLAYLTLAEADPHNAAPLLEAVQRGKEDLAAANAATPCPFDRNFTACTEQQGITWPAVGRIRSCNDLSWLPY